ncbi:MAG: TonB-dependent receptor [Pseudomonadota bacterium]
MRRHVTICLSLLTVNSLSLAQEAPKSQQVPQVIVDGSQTDLEKSREFVAGKLIIGKKTIAESALQNVGEILRREPAISIGKDGRIGLMGLPGYTQVLVDGAPPSGRDPFELDLVHIERIEIIKSATAATGPFGIAGTINIVRRKVTPSRFSQFNIGASNSAGRFGANLSWMNNQAVSNTPLSVNLSLSASDTEKPSSDHYQNVLTRTGSSAESVLQGDRSSIANTGYVLAAGELAWKVNPDHVVRFSPDLGRVTVTQDGDEHRRWADGRTFAAHENAKEKMSSYSLPLQWAWRTENDSQVELKLTNNRSIGSSSKSQRTNSGPQTTSILRINSQRSENVNRFLNLNYRTDFTGGHELEAGANATQNNSETAYDDFIDGGRDSALAILGPRTTVEKQSYRLFIQDDWRLNKVLAVNAGISVERQELKLNNGSTSNRSHFLMWAPSAHIVRKFAGSNKRQLRLSIARTFQAPNTTQMGRRPSVNSLATCDASRLCTANSPDTADSVGNPTLLPERAAGLNFSYALGLRENSEVSADYHLRRITHKIGSELALVEVPWSNAARYIVRPANLGEARIQGVDVNLRLNSRDFWKEAAKVDVTANVGIAHSELSDLPGPDNRLAGHSPWHAKLGLAYTASEWPLKLNLDANWLPGDWVRNNLSQRTFQSRKVTLNTNANWKINSDIRFSLNIDNLLRTNPQRIDEYFTSAGTVREETQGTAHRRIGLRLEIKL